MEDNSIASRMFNAGYKHAKLGGSNNYPYATHSEDEKDAAVWWRRGYNYYKAGLNLD